jgi:hypothetical protein
MKILWTASRLRAQRPITFGKTSSYDKIGRGEGAARAGFLRALIIPLSRPPSRKEGALYVRMANLWERLRA